MNPGGRLLPSIAPPPPPQEGGAGGDTTADQTYQPVLCSMHGWSLACCWLPNALGYMLTWVDAQGVRHVMQNLQCTASIHQCKTSSYGPTEC